MIRLNVITPRAPTSGSCGGCLRPTWSRPLAMGEDLYCARAREYIQQLCQREGIDVHFLVGGTQTNTTVIAAALRPHQGGDRGHQRAH